MVLFINPGQKVCIINVNVLHCCGDSRVIELA